MAKMIGTIRLHSGARAWRLLVAPIAVASIGVTAAACGGGGGAQVTAKAPSTPAGDAGASTSQPTATSEPTTNTPEAAPSLTGPAKEAYDRGVAAYKAGDLNGAKAAFSDASKKQQDSAACHYSLGVVLERLGQAADAQQEYRAAYTYKPDYTAAMGAYALSLAHSGHGGEADTFLTDKHNRQPDSAPISTYLSMVKSIEGDSGSAQSLAQDALRIDPNYQDAMVAIARDHFHAHRDQLAEYALGAILVGVGDTTPPRAKDNAEAHLLRGLIEKQSGRRAAAMQDFTDANAKKPDLVEATIQLGVMKLEAGNAQEAQPLLESAVKYAPQDPIAHVNLGDAYRLLGRTADAKREMETALQLDSTLAVAHYDLGLLYLFSPNVGGFQPLDQVAKSITELETYKTMRAKPQPGQPDDQVDDLLSRAKAKQAELKTPPAAAAPPPAASGSAAPAAAAAAAPAASGKPDAGAADAGK